MKTKAVILSLAVFLITSCSEEKDNVNIPTETINEFVDTSILVKKEVDLVVDENQSGKESYTATTEYIYNENKIFKKTITDGTDKLSYSYIYTGELITECIISNEKNEVFKILYKYNDNKKLIEASELRPLDDLALKRTYTYNNDGTISATVYQGDLAKQTKIVHTYLITLDQEGEVAKSVIYNSLEDIYVTNTYTYDTKNNPFKNITGYGALNIDGGISGNLSRNILSQTIIRADKSKIEVFYSYEYNSNGFPTKKSAKIDVDGVKSDFTKITSY